jgi:hypothetical protein
VFESGSRDATLDWLRILSALLEPLHIHHTIVAGGRESLKSLGKGADRIK